MFNFRMLFIVLKYGTILGFVGFLAYSVYSSYTLRTTVGQLKEELKTEQNRSKELFEQLKKHSERLEQLRIDKENIQKELNSLRQSTDEEFFENLYHLLYFNSPDRLPNN